MSRGPVPPPSRAVRAVTRVTTRAVTRGAVLALAAAAAAGCQVNVVRRGAAAPSPNAAADPAAAAAARTEIAAMMARSAEAWNRGDLDAFVEDYVPGEPPDPAAATYIGSRGIVRGRAAIRAAYAPRFAPGVRRGTLRFENLEVDLLAPGVANAIAFYVLSERTAAGADSTVSRGPTSLVMRRSAGGRWQIAHDHSS